MIYWGMKISIRYFASLRESVGRTDETLSVPEDTRVSSISTLLATHYPALQPILPRCVCAVNHHYVTADTVLQEGDEVVFIPPTGGGAWNPLFK
jgi:sulfur-carrier protein